MTKAKPKPEEAINEAFKEAWKEGESFQLVHRKLLDPTKIPRRGWLYKPHYVRQFVSVTVAMSGTIKTNLAIAESLAMVSGKPLLGVSPERKLKVFYWNGEDPLVELDRRFAAAQKHYGLSNEDLGERLFYSDGNETPIVIAQSVRQGFSVTKPIVESVIKTIQEYSIDVLNIDPFVSCHTVHENDNSAIDAVAKQWAKIAQLTNCSIMLNHHPRKIGSEGIVTADDARGAGSLNAAGRSTRTLNKMTKNEADQAEIDERERWRYIRLDDGKNNLAPPAVVATWFRSESVNFGNIQDDWEGSGDQIGVVTSWNYPRIEQRDHTAYDIRRVQEVLKNGGPWREHQLVKKIWVGIPIAETLAYDLDKPMEKTAVVKLIKDWVRMKYLRIYEAPDDKREVRKWIEVGHEPEA